MRHHTNRKRIFHWICEPGKPVHGHAFEFFLEGIILLAACMFVVGSYCFLSESSRVVEAGDILYIVASLIYTCVSLYSMREYFQAQYHLTMAERVEDDMEFLEHVCYVVSCLVFTVGTVLYWPHLYGDNEVKKLRGEYAASWCFISGSFGFVVASFFNAVGMTLSKTSLHVPGIVARRCYWLSVFSLFFSLMGGVLFVVGSYLYRPEFDTHCKDFQRVAEDSFEAEWCLNTVTSGTWLYIVGSICYVVQGGLNLWKCCIKARAEDRAATNNLQLVGAGASTLRLATAPNTHFTGGMRPFEQSKTAYMPMQTSQVV